TASGAPCTAPGFVVSPGFLAFASVKLPQLTLHLNAGYTWDNSENLLPGNWPSFATYALGLSRYDRLSFGLAAEVPVERFAPFSELTVDVPMDRRYFGSCTGTESATCGPRPPLFPARAGQVPARLGLGTRYEIAPNLGVDLAL